MRLIDADELKEHKFVECLEWETDFSNGWNAAIEAVVRFAPTVESIKHGRWIKLYHGNYKCSECGAWWGSDYNDEVINDFNYCPNCGAKMGEVEE